MFLRCKVYGEEEKGEMEDLGCRLVAGEHDDECVAGDLFFTEAPIFRGVLAFCLEPLCFI